MKRTLVLLVAIVLLASHGIAAGASVIVSDDFDDGVIDAALWTVFQSGYMTVEEADGVLKVGGPGGDPGVRGGLECNLELTGDFDVSVDYHWAAYDGSGDARGQLWIANAASTEVEAIVLNCHRWSAAGSRELILIHRYGGAPHNQCWISGNAVPLSGKLRIRREGTTFYGYYLDSGAWIFMCAVDAFGTPARASLVGNNRRHNYPPASFEVDFDNFRAEFEIPAVVEVAIDVKPGSWPNAINKNGKGVIPVAILGSADFEVTQIDVSTLSFEGMAVRVKGNDQPQCSIDDVSGDFSTPEGAPDGYDDLVCQFVDDTSSWTVGDGEATLTGQLLDGTPFEGTDSIKVVQ